MRYSRANATPLLSADEEVALAQEVEAGQAAEKRMTAGRATVVDARLASSGTKARRRFIEANLRLVLSVAGRTRVPGHVDRDDVVQDGMLGLERAGDEFDWRRGYRFSTYATWWIKQSIQSGLEVSASSVRIPARTASELKQARAANGGPTTARARAAEAMNSIDSLDREIGDSDARRLGDLVACTAPGPDDTIDALGDTWAVGELIGRLDDTSAQIVVARFGLDGREPETLAMIADRHGVSPEAIRRRLGRALDALRPVAARLTATSPAAYAALAA